MYILAQSKPCLQTTYIPRDSRIRSCSSFLDLPFVRELYNKGNSFNFHVVNFPYLSGNVLSAPSYVIYVSQLMHDATHIMMSSCLRTSFYPLPDCYLCYHHPCMYPFKCLDERNEKHFSLGNIGLSEIHNL